MDTSKPTYQQPVVISYTEADIESELGEAQAYDGVIPYRTVRVIK